MSTTVHICCPGPSLEYSWLTEEVKDPIYCVNMALDSAPRCDYWAAIDQPNEVHAVCRDKHRELHPTLLTHTKRVANWRTFGVLERIETVDEVLKETVLRDMEVKTRYTIYWTIGHALSKGARRLIFHGVDMAGVGYHNANPRGHYGPAGDEKRWKARWDHKEAAGMREVYKLLRRAGIRTEGLPVLVTGPMKEEPEYVPDLPVDIPAHLVHKWEWPEEEGK